MTRLAPLAAAALVTASTCFAADSATLLPPTPLVLKDGRIAHVTVHTVTFPLGKDEPDQPAQDALATLVDELATDCFLTAQAVGHVEPGPGNDGETLAAHRLARARAERVQAALTGRGLPANSIASVWDWQFAVREPRVTLWVFRLAEGDDCDSRPIARVEPPPSVDATTPVAVTAPDAPITDETPAAAEPEVPARPEMIVDRMPEPVSEAPTTVAESAPEPTPAPESQPPSGQELVTMAAPEEPVTEAAADRPVNVAEITPEPAPETLPPAPAPPEELVAVAVPEEPASEAALDKAVNVAAAEATEMTTVSEEEPALLPEEPQGSALAVSFDMNSSYFRKEVSRELDSLVEGLAPYGGYEILLEGSVSAEPLRNRPPEEALAYNRWIADRRMERVADWLRRKLNGSVSITQAYVENDSSRRVTITVKPVS